MQVILILLLGVPVDSVVLNNVSNLPPGISYACNVPSCTWYGDSAGCANIDGMPTTNGSFQITLDITGWVTIFFNPSLKLLLMTGM